MTKDMTTMKIHNIKSRLLRSLLVVAMMVWGVGEAAGDDYVFMFDNWGNGPYNFLYNNNNQIGNTTDFDASTCVFIGPTYGTTSGTFQSKSNTSYYLHETEDYTTNTWGNYRTYTQTLGLSTSSTTYSIDGNKVYYNGYSSAQYSISWTGGSWSYTNANWNIYYNNGSWVSDQYNSGEYLYKCESLSTGLSVPEISGYSRLSQTGDFTYSASSKYLPEHYRFTGKSTYYYYDGAMSTSQPNGVSTGVTYSYSLSANTYATVNATTGVITVNSLPASDTELTLTVTASKTGAESVSNTKTITLSPNAYSSETGGMYVIYSGGNNGEYLGNSADGQTNFDPTTCIWSGTSGGNFTNGTYWLRNDNNFLNSQTNAVNCTLFGNEDGTTGQYLRLANNRYLYYTGGKWTRGDKNYTEGVYSVDKRTYDEVYIAPAVNGEDEFAQLGPKQYTYVSGTYTKAYVDYVFYNGTSHF